jgi:hypothetical protein
MYSKKQMALGGAVMEELLGPNYDVRKGDGIDIPKKRKGAEVNDLDVAGGTLPVPKEIGSIDGERSGPSDKGYSETELGTETLYGARDGRASSEKVTASTGTFEDVEKGMRQLGFSASGARMMALTKLVKSDKGS